MWGAYLKARATYFLLDWVLTTNHRRLAILYFVFIGVTGFTGLSLATLIRLELAYPGCYFLANNAEKYLTLISLHGIVMVFFVVMPLIFGAFANFLLPTQLGVRDVAFPRLNSLMFWITPSGFVLLLHVILLDQAATTSYWLSNLDQQAQMRRRYLRIAPVPHAQHLEPTRRSKLAACTAGRSDDVVSLASTARCVTLTPPTFPAASSWPNPAFWRWGQSHLLALVQGWGVGVYACWGLLKPTYSAHAGPTWLGVTRMSLQTLINPSPLKQLIPWLRKGWVVSEGPSLGTEVLFFGGATPCRRAWGDLRVLDTTLSRRLQAEYAGLGYPPMSKRLQSWRAALWVARSWVLALFGYGTPSSTSYGWWDCKWTKSAEVRVAPADVGLDGWVRSLRAGFERALGLCCAEGWAQRGNLWFGASGGYLVSGWRDVCERLQQLSWMGVQPGFLKLPTWQDSAHWVWRGCADAQIGLRWIWRRSVRTLNPLGWGHLRQLRPVWISAHPGLGSTGIERRLSAYSAGLRAYDVWRQMLVLGDLAFLGRKGVELAWTMAWRGLIGDPRFQLLHSVDLAYRTLQARTRQRDALSNGIWDNVYWYSLFLCAALSTLVWPTGTAWEWGLSRTSGPYWRLYEQDDHVWACARLAPVLMSGMVLSEWALRVSQALWRLLGVEECGRLWRVLDFVNLGLYPSIRPWQRLFTSLVCGGWVPAPLRNTMPWPYPRLGGECWGSPLGPATLRELGWTSPKYWAWQTVPLANLSTDIGTPQILWAAGARVCSLLKPLRSALELTIWEARNSLCGWFVGGIASQWEDSTHVVLREWFVSTAWQPATSLSAQPLKGGYAAGSAHPKWLQQAAVLAGGGPLPTLTTVISRELPGLLRGVGYQLLKLAGYDTRVVSGYGRPWIQAVGEWYREGGDTPVSCFWATSLTPSLNSILCAQTFWKQGALWVGSDRLILAGVVQSWRPLLALYQDLSVAVKAASPGVCGWLCEVYAGRGRRLVRSMFSRFGLVYWAGRAYPDTKLVDAPSYAFGKWARIFSSLKTGLASLLACGGWSEQRGVSWVPHLAAPLLQAKEGVAVWRWLRFVVIDRGQQWLLALRQAFQTVTGKSAYLTYWATPAACGRISPAWMVEFLLRPIRNLGCAVRYGMRGDICLDSERALSTPVWGVRDPSDSAQHWVFTKNRMSGSRPALLDKRPSQVVRAVAPTRAPQPSTGVVVSPVICPTVPVTQHATPCLSAQKGDPRVMLAQRLFQPLLTWQQLKLERGTWRCLDLLSLSARPSYDRSRFYGPLCGLSSEVTKISTWPATNLIPGWAFITPYASRLRFTAVGKIDVALSAVFLAALGSVVSAINYLVTYRYVSAPLLKNRRELRSFFTDSILVASRMILLANPALLIGIALLLSDRHLGTSVFDFSGGGDVVLFQHLFWFFGHPEVYIIIIPCFGITNALLPQYLRKRLSGRLSLQFSMYTIAFMGFLVWGHHLYMVGLANSVRTLYSTMTVMISVPASTKVLHWCVTLIQATPVLDVGFCFLLSFIYFFILGGLSGMFVAHVGFDTLFHDTFFVIGHFHVMLAGAAMSCLFAAFYFYFSALFGIRYSRFWAFCHFSLYTGGQVLTLTPMFWLGYAGMPRRVLDYPAVFGGWHSAATSGHFLTALSLLCFVCMLWDSFYENQSVARKHRGVSRLNTRLSHYTYELAKQAQSVQTGLGLKPTSARLRSCGVYEGSNVCYTFKA